METEHPSFHLLSQLVKSFTITYKCSPMNTERRRTLKTEQIDNQYKLLSFQQKNFWETMPEKIPLEFVFSLEM